jgi:hypothetical protein
MNTEKIDRGTKVYAALGAIEFAELCAGKDVALDGVGEGRHFEVKLVLSDIGFDAMEDAVARARHRRDFRPGEPVVEP